MQNVNYKNDFSKFVSKTDRALFDDLLSPCDPVAMALRSISTSGDLTGAFDLSGVEVDDVISALRADPKTLQLALRIFFEDVVEKAPGIAVQETLIANASSTVNLIWVDSRNPYRIEWYGLVSPIMRSFYELRKQAERQVGSDSADLGSILTFLANVTTAHMSEREFKKTVVQYFITIDLFTSTIPAQILVLLRPLSDAKNCGKFKVKSIYNRILALIKTQG